MRRSNATRPGAVLNETEPWSIPQRYSSLIDETAARALLEALAGRNEQGRTT